MIADPGSCSFPDYADMEKQYIAHLSTSLSQHSNQECQKPMSSLTQEIQKAREHIRTSLEKMSATRPFDISRIDELEKVVTNLIERISALESKIGKFHHTTEAGDSVNISQSAHKEISADALFDFDSENEMEGKRLKAERIAKIEANKLSEPSEVAKSSIVLDVKPWDDETDMEEMTKKVRSIQADGLVWGESRIVPHVYGIKKLQICCVIEDDKISSDFLEEAITAFEDHVQSVDIISFNKV